MSMTDSLLADAYHEAGHAVAAVIMGIRLISVDIRPQPLPGGGIGRAGANLVRPLDDDILGQGEDAVRPFLVTIIAGVFAEQLVNHGAGLEAGHTHADGTILQKYATAAVCTPVREAGEIVIRGNEVQENLDRIGALMEDAKAFAEQLVTNHRQAIEAVATALLKNQILAGDEVEELVAANSPPAA